MGKPTIWERLTGWLAMLPIRLAYRLVWLAACTRNRTARDVYAAMWDANLDLPPLRKAPSRA